MCLGRIPLNVPVSHAEMDFLKSLIVLSEKAANIARIIRGNDRLFKLLVEKKSSDEANPRFVDDFKTLADVLIQEMVKHEIKRQFPDIGDRICGEESNEFCNQLGEKIVVEMMETEEETSSLLTKALNGDEETAEILAREVHRTVNIEEVSTKMPDADFELEIDKLGVWIDPIDATVEYINGEERGCKSGIYLSGLKCVTILIGAFNQETGQPVIGVVNQPFLPRNSKSYRCMWGVCLQPTVSLSSCDMPQRESKIICVSGSEDSIIKEKLTSAGYDLIESCGAGYKILTVILGLADAYILSKPSTFFWDTCAPQAILRAVGGDVIRFDDAMVKAKVSIEYAFCRLRSNNGGIIAFRSEHFLDEVLEVLTKE